MADPTRLALELIAETLGGLSGRWKVRGDMVRGSGTTAVVVRRHVDGSATHLDFGFVLNRKNPDATTIWDCSGGTGDGDEAVRGAVEIWSASTAPVVLELLTGTGRFATHCPYDDPIGFTGWHSIIGPVTTWGTAEASELLQQWFVETPVLPRLTEAITPHLDRPVLNGVKLFIGGGEEDIAEVSVNGMPEPTASSALAALPWPRPSDFAVARLFALLVHQENESGIIGWPH